MRRKNFKNIVTEAIKDCFTAGTKIQTVEGEKNIEDIQVGDKVLAKDEKTGKQEYKEVVHLFQKQVDTIYQVHIGKEVIETTAEHPFWVAEKGWVQAKDLQPGDQLETDQGQHVKVTQIAKQEKQTTVYNFEVKDYHTYYVSGLHLLVHNMCGKIFESRRAAFRAAKRDAGLRSNAHPYQVKSVNMEDRNGKVILDSNYRPIKTREYYFKRSNDLEDIVIQEHSAGHYYGEGGIGDQGPHFNVRPISKRRTGKVEGTLEHYEFIK